MFINFLKIESTICTLSIIIETHFDQFITTIKLIMFSVSRRTKIFKIYPKQHFS